MWTIYAPNVGLPFLVSHQCEISFWGVTNFMSQLRLQDWSFIKLLATIVLAACPVSTK
jgi:hypothetical protein